MYNLATIVIEKTRLMLQIISDSTPIFQKQPCNINLLPHNTTNHYWLFHSIYLLICAAYRSSQNLRERIIISVTKRIYITYHAHKHALHTTLYMFILNIFTDRHIYFIVNRRNWCKSRGIVWIGIQIHSCVKSRTDWLSSICYIVK